MVLRSLGWTYTRPSPSKRIWKDSPPDSPITERQLMPAWKCCWRLPVCATYAPGSTCSGRPGATRSTTAGPSEVIAAWPTPSTVVVNRPLPCDAPRRPVKVVPVRSVASVASRLLASTYSFSPFRRTRLISLARSAK